VHDPERQAAPVADNLGNFCDAAALDVEEQVLAVPGLDRGVLPEPRPEPVDERVPSRREEGLPIVRPLLVHVPDATLARDRCREGDDRGQLRQRLDMGRRVLRPEVLGHLE
jgi:hypothetical protein